MTLTSQAQPIFAPEPIGAVRAAPGAAPSPSATASRAAADEVQTRFWNLLIPAAATIAGTFGKQIGAAVGGAVGGQSGAATGGSIGGSVGSVLSGLGGGLDLGGLFGGRQFAAGDDPGTPAGDITVPLVQQCTLQCVGQMIPDLAEMLKGLKLPAESGGSRSGRDEIAAIERFWPQIAAFIGEKVATHLPDIIKTVTGAAIPLLGARAAGDFRPILTGTETHARWFIPVLSSVLTAVQQNLPALVAAVGGGARAPRETAITATDLFTYGRFWDNDFIRVVGQEALADSGSVTIVLELAPHLSWRKEIQLRDDNGALIKRLAVQDNNKWAEDTVRYDQIGTNGSLLFAKAKMFGFMTGMYVLPTAGMTQLQGKRTHIRWMAD